MIYHDKITHSHLVPNIKLRVIYLKLTQSRHSCNSLGRQIVRILFHEIYHSYGNVTIAVEGLQHLDLCSALMTFNQGGIFIVPHLMTRSLVLFSRPVHV